ncbi:MAG TPA: hypothetical protein VIY55_15340 [Acetobacteraceae bacterium]
MAWFQAYRLEQHPSKTRIVYRKDINRTRDHPDIQVTFLGYTFRPRKAVDKYGRVYVNPFPLPRIGAQTGVAEHEPVPDPVADAQVQGAGSHETRAAEMLKTMPDDAVSWDCIPATILFRLVIRASPAACAVFLVASLVGNGRVRG